MNGKILMALFLSCLAAHAWAERMARPLAVCPAIEPKEAPKVDGKLDEAVWKKSKELSRFWLRDGSAPASQQTHARVLCDGEKLYIGAVCDEAGMDKLAAKQTKRDGSVWNDDCIELFLAPHPDKPDYFHVIVGAAGAIYDAKDEDRSFNAKVRSGVARGEKSWTVEVAIELASLAKADQGYDPRRLGEGDVIHFNLCREKKPNGELSCWSAIAGGFANRRAFGDLVVGSLDAPQAKLLGSLRRALSLARGKTVDAGGRDEDEFAALNTRAEKLLNKAATPIAQDQWQAFRDAAKAVERGLVHVALRPRGLVLWEPNAWRLPMPEDLPDGDVPDAEAIEVWTFGNEWESRALAVSNMTRRNVHCRVRLHEFLSVGGATTVPADEVITVRTAVPTGLRSGARMLDALPRLQEGGLFSVGAGSNQALWLTFRTKGLSPGRYNGILTIYDLERTNVKKHVRLTLTVYPIPLDAGPLPYAECWDYWLNLSGLPLAERRQHWRDYYLNVGTVHYSELPGYDAKKYCMRHDKLDFAKMDQAIDETRDFTKFYLIELGRWGPMKKLGDPPAEMWSDEYNRRLAVWVRAVRDHMKAKGFEYEEWAFYPYDEPHAVETRKLFLRACQEFKKIDPEIQIYTTMGEVGEGEYGKLFAPLTEYVDIWQVCPIWHFSQEGRDLIAAKGAKLWEYHVRGKGSYYAPYRTDLALAGCNGATGIGFWSWVYYKGASSWDDFDNVPDKAYYHDWAAVYYEDGTIIPSLRAEGFREGVEDFKYLLMLDRAVAEAADAGVDPKLIETARSQKQRIIAGKGDPATVEDFRATVRRQIAALGAAAGTIDLAAIRAVEDPGPACLTGNGGPRAVNVHTGGSYTPGKKGVDTHKKGSEYTAGPIYFRAEDAKEGHQLTSKTDGGLTDGIDYVGLCFPWGGVTDVNVVFDLRKEFLIERLSLSPTMCRANEPIVEVKDDGEDARWIRVGGSENVEGELDNPRGTIQLPLKPTKGRYLRLHVTKAPDERQIILYEAQIWGRVLETE